MHVEFGILGPVEIVRGGQPATPGRPRERLALGLLLLEPNRHLPADRLLDLIWHDDPPQGGKRVLQTVVSRLRRTLVELGGAAELVTRDDGYELNVAPDAIDAHRFRALLRDARAAADDAERVRVLRAALELWRGPFLGDLPLPAVRGRLAGSWKQARLTATEDLYEAELRLGRNPQLADELVDLVASHPTSERLVAALMLTHYRGGRTAMALGAFDACRRRLAGELGIDPQPALRALHLRILQGDQGLVAEADGRSRNRQPDHPRPRQLPPAAPAFTGRQAELAELDTVLDQSGPHLRAWVISGVAGVGKTSLALEWAHRWAEERFPDGQLFANLHGCHAEVAPSAAGDVLERFLRALGTPDERVPQDLDERSALFRSLLHGRRVLIFLDNVSKPEQVRPLLPGNSDCCVVVTARRHLGSLVAADGVRPLTLRAVGADEATLLLERVVGQERINAEATAARQLIDLCEGLPLALRIVAARLAVRPLLPLRDLADALADEHDRLDQLRLDEVHVRGSLELSYRRLPADQQLAFRQLSLLEMPSGFTAWHLAAMLDTSVEQAWYALEDLADIQLVHPLGRDQAGQPRYEFHDLVRLFARERARMETTPADAAHARHRALHYYLATVRAASLHLRPTTPDVIELAPEHPGRELADRTAATSWTDAERDNLVALTSQAMRSEAERRICPELAVASFLPLALRGWLPEVIAINGVALDVAQRIGHHDGQVRAWEAMGIAHSRLGHAEEALNCHEKALALTVESGDDARRSLVLGNLGTLHRRQSRFEEAASCSEQALTLFEEMGDAPMCARTLNNLGLAYRSMGRHDQSVAVFERSLAIARELGDLEVEGGVLGNLAETLRQAGDLGTARTQFLEAIDVVGTHYPLSEAEHLWGLGRTEHALGSHDRARECWRRSVSILVHHRLIDEQESREILAQALPPMPEPIRRDM